MIASHLATAVLSRVRSRSQAPGRRVVRRSGRAATSLLLVLSLFSLAFTSSCDKVPLTAPTQSTITLFSNTTVVPLNGTAEITANVIESAGTAVQNGTVVDFTTTIGTIDPAEARTNGGKATVRLITSGQSGTATVRAFSGGNTSGDLTLTVGAAAVKTVTLTANPGSVSATQGGTSTLTAVVFDESGNPIPGIPVSFTATAGQLSQTSVLTNGSGVASTTLRTTLQSQVQATAGAVQSAQVTIAVNNAPRVSITAPTTLQAGVLASFSYSITTDTGVGIRSGYVDWGDGTGRSSVNNTSGSVSHAFTSAGTYTVTISATDVNGETGTNNTTAFVTGTGLVGSVAATPNPTTTTGATTLTVTLSSTSQTGNIKSVTFDPGDGEDFIFDNAGLTTTYKYHRTGTFTLTATLNYVDGTKSQPMRTTVIVN